MMQKHVGNVWLPAMKLMVQEIHQPTEVPRVLKVFKTHMTLVHSTDRLITLGPLQVGKLNLEVEGTNEVGQEVGHCVGRLQRNIE